jgi:hypothetical protein
MTGDLRTRLFTAESAPLSFGDPAIESESYERVQGAAVVIHPQGRFLYRVALTDKPEDERRTHLAEYYLNSEDGQLQGRCACDGWRFHDGPCAHLWGLHEADRHETIERYETADALGDESPRCPACGERPSAAEGM